MLETEKDKETCKKYRAKDENGLCHCDDCPLVYSHFNMVCKAIAHRTDDGDWELDICGI